MCKHCNQHFPFLFCNRAHLNLLKSEVKIVKEPHFLKHSITKICHSDSRLSIACPLYHGTKYTVLNVVYEDLKSTSNWRQWLKDLCHGPLCFIVWQQHFGCTGERVHWKQWCRNSELITPCLQPSWYNVKGLRWLWRILCSATVLLI